MLLEKIWLSQPTLEHLWRDRNSPHTPRHIMFSRVASMPVWNDKMAGQQATSGQVSALRHHYMHALDMDTIIVFVYLGLQFKWNQISSNNSHHTSCIYKGLHADSVSTLGYHWTNYTGTTLADASTQWCPGGNPVLICIIWTHWKTTGNTLETHWLPTILTPVASQFTLRSKFQAHWIATGSPPNYHWLRVRV